MQKDLRVGKAPKSIPTDEKDDDDDGDGRGSRGESFLAMKVVRWNGSCLRLEEPILIERFPRRLSRFHQIWPS